MTRIPFQPFGYTDGTSEGCAPSPLWTGPRCTCTQPWAQLNLGAELYTALNRITDAGCPVHGEVGAHIPNPHEPAGHLHLRSTVTKGVC
jgi:hypothetical protein